MNVMLYDSYCTSHTLFNDGMGLNKSEEEDLMHVLACILWNWDVKIIDRFPIRPSVVENRNLNFWGVTSANPLDKIISKLCFELRTWWNVKCTVFWKVFTIFPKIGKPVFYTGSVRIKVRIKTSSWHDWKTEQCPYQLVFHFQ